MNDIQGNGIEYSIDSIKEWLDYAENGGWFQSNDGEFFYASAWLDQSVAEIIDWLILEVEKLKEEIGS